MLRQPQVGAFAIGKFSDYLQPRLQLQQAPVSGTHHRVVVGNDDPQGTRGSGNIQRRSLTGERLTAGLGHM